MTAKVPIGLGWLLGRGHQGTRFSELPHKYAKSVDIPSDRAHMNSGRVLRRLAQNQDAGGYFRHEPKGN